MLNGAASACACVRKPVCVHGCRCGFRELMPTDHDVKWGSRRRVCVCLTAAMLPEYTHHPRLWHRSCPCRRLGDLAPRQQCSGGGLCCTVHLALT